jgi:hypothetical protein
MVMVTGTKMSVLSLAGQQHLNDCRSTRTTASILYASRGTEDEYISVSHGLLFDCFIFMAGVVCSFRSQPYILGLLAPQEDSR